MGFMDAILAAIKPACQAPFSVLIIAAMSDPIAAYFKKIGSRGGFRAAKKLGKAGLSARAKRAWRTRKANGRGKK